MIVYCRYKRGPLVLVETCKSAMRGQLHWSAKHITALVQRCIKGKRSQAGSKRPGHSKAWTWLSSLWMPVSVPTGCWYTRSCHWLPFLGAQAYLPRSTANVDMSSGLRSEWSEILGVKLWNRQLGGFWGVFVNTARWLFFLLHFKCIVTKEKSMLLFLQQCELTQGTNTKLGLLLFKLL